MFPTRVNSSASSSKPSDVYKRQPRSPADLSLAEKCAGRPAVAILNKTDLPQQADEESLRPYFSTVVNLSLIHI